jgi:hypothetical protein
VNFFNIIALLPREKRRKSQREVEKGVTGQECGRPRSCAEDAKRARRRRARARGLHLARHLLQSNPSGSKKLREYEKARSGLSSKNVSYIEASRLYAMREERAHLVGDRRFFRDPVASVVRGAFA